MPPLLIDFKNKLICKAIATSQATQVDGLLIEVQCDVNNKTLSVSSSCDAGVIMQPSLVSGRKLMDDMDLTFDVTFLVYQDVYTHELSMTKIDNDAIDILEGNLDFIYHNEIDLDLYMSMLCFLTLAYDTMLP